MENVEIRLSEERDLPEIRRIYQELVDEQSASLFSMEIMQKEISESNNNFVFVALLDGVVVGTAQLIIYKNFIRLPKLKGLIDSVVVSEKYRGRGIGGALIEAVISFSIKSGVCMITLVSSYKRYLSYSFYRKMGFDNLGLGFTYIQNE